MDNGNTGKQPAPWQEGVPVQPQDQALAQPFPPGYGPYYEEEEIDLREYLAVILRRRWTVVAVLLLVVFTMAFNAIVGRLLGPEGKGLAALATMEQMAVRGTAKRWPGGLQEPPFSLLPLAMRTYATLRR